MLQGNEMPRIGRSQEEKTRALLAKKEQFVAKGISAAAPIFIESAKGAAIRDLDGNTYLDLYGGIGVNNAGHCPTGVVEAVRNQAEKLLHSCFMVSMYDSYVELAEQLAQVLFRRLLGEAAHEEPTGDRCGAAGCSPVLDAVHRFGDGGERAGDLLGGRDRDLSRASLALEAPSLRLLFLLPRFLCFALPLGG